MKEIPRDKLYDSILSLTKVLEASTKQQKAFIAKLAQNDQASDKIVTKETKPKDKKGK